MLEPFVVVLENSMQLFAWPTRECARGRQWQASSASIEDARGHQVPGCAPARPTSWNTGQMRSATHCTIQASFVAAALRVRSCGGTLQCEQCRAFGSGAGKSWLRSAGSRPAALNARGRRPGGSRRTTLNRPARRGSGARPSGIAATASGGGSIRTQITLRVQ